jgi:hypothetical protein
MEDSELLSTARTVVQFLLTVADFHLSFDESNSFSFFYIPVFSFLTPELPAAQTLHAVHAGIKHMWMSRHSTLPWKQTHC